MTRNGYFRKILFDDTSTTEDYILYKGRPALRSHLFLTYRACTVKIDPLDLEEIGYLIFDNPILSLEVSQKCRSTLSVRRRLVRIISRFQGTRMVLEDAYIRAIETP